MNYVTDDTMNAYLRSIQPMYDGVLGEIQAVSCNFFTKFGKASVRGIPSLTFFQTVNTFFTDVPRCLEIWFADTQRNDIVHFVSYIKKLTDTRRFYR